MLTGRCRPGSNQDRREAIDQIAQKNVPELYDDLAEATTEGALIVVTGYPQLFEDPTTSWLPVNALTRRCHGMHFDDAEMIRGLAGRLNQAVGAAVEAAAKRHPGRTWVFADVSFPFDGHGLCSDQAESWINGITTGLLDGDFRYKRSFHPNQDGHTEGYAGFISGFRQLEEWRPADRSDESSLGPAARLNLTGLGPVKVGMTIEEALRVTDGALKLQVADEICRQFSAEDLADVTFISHAEADDSIEFIILTGGEVATESGIRVGSSKDSVVDVYDNGLLPGHYDILGSGEGAIYQPDPSSRYALAFNFDGDVVTRILLFPAEYKDSASFCG